MIAFKRWRAQASNPRSITAGLPFWLLVTFLAMVFATGGSSFGNVPQLVVLRPVAVLLIGYGIATLRREHWRTYRIIFLMAIAIVSLTVLHLVPLPPTLWHFLPGRGLLRMIDETAGLNGQWRPLTLTPSRTVNALFALTIPVATLLLAAQLQARDRVWILYVLLVLIAVSSLIGLLQAAGLPISLFHVIVDSEKVEATGLFANQNHQAALLACAIPMIAVMARTIGYEQKAVQRLAKPLAMVAGLVFIVQLIVTGSRAGLMLGAIALGFTLFYGLLQSDRLERLPLRVRLASKMVLIVIVAGGAAIATSFAARGLALQRLGTVSADLRPRLWASILPILSDYQPLGSGIGSYVEVYRSHEPLSLLRTTYSNHAHNEYLEVLLTSGLPGILILLVAAVLLVTAFWRNRRGAESGAIFARLGVTIIIILASASITDYPLRTPLLSSVFVLAALWCVRPAGNRC
ncbi:O-antigen ligase family protein [Sphingomonas sp. 1185]|uniref:O-antigen ligase family protein n=1 Tax=Sphingomonas sp. 1185 TaxID=3156411 RepID=UPI003393C6E6